MTSIKELRKTNDNIWEYLPGKRLSHRQTVRIFSDDRLLEDALADQSLEQAANVAALPGLAGPVMVMPDMHQGYGMPIGGVMAADLQTGVISPGAVGYDINCGVRLMASSIPVTEAEPYLADLSAALARTTPRGLGERGVVSLTSGELQQVCREGSRWALKNGYATTEDVECTEDSGCLDGADVAPVSPRAMERAKNQLGSLGSGNHFLEVDYVDQIFDEGAAAAFGISAGCLVVQIHSGSRGLGHQICTDFVKDFQTVARRYDIELPDRELVCAPIDSPEGRAYSMAMNAAANFAFTNRQLLAWCARRSFEEVLAGKSRAWELRAVYDLAHNIAKWETHTIGGRQQSVCVHRKGATRAYGPGAPELPARYRSTGQPVLVPGSMGTASWVLVGAAKSMEISYGTACHGAGRVMSRAQAKREVRGGALLEDLRHRGVRVNPGSLSGLAEEAPQAYKDVDRVIEVMCQTGIARKVARLLPVIVVKG
jgi:tRNA-splicing ligase RtcB (3'-phosphate/5'-hydroxy nucleic acid ligase)